MPLFFQAEYGKRDLYLSRGLGYVYKRHPVDKDNYEEIIVEGGYYTADQLAG